MRFQAAFCRGLASVVLGSGVAACHAEESFAEPASNQQPDTSGRPDAAPASSGMVRDGAAPPGADSGLGFDEADLRALLVANQPGSAHEAIPHGVPNSYDWYAQSRASAVRVDPRLASLNWWAQVYVDTSGVRPRNTRVAVRGGVALLLFEGETAWRVAQRSDALEGGSWSEDFQRYPCGAFNMRVEPDGSHSFVPDPNCAAHFWPNVAHVDLGSRTLRAVVAIAHARLVLHDATAHDDRAAARYLTGLGVDWRDPVGGCPPNDAGTPICSGAGVGRMVLPTAGWRPVVFSTMTIRDLATLPLPPIHYFQRPEP